METTIQKGWNYISAIFKVLLVKSNANDSLIEPHYIFRGITKRWFSTSTLIENNMIEIISEIISASPARIDEKKEWILNNLVDVLNIDSKKIRENIENGKINNLEHNNIDEIINKVKVSIVEYLLNLNLKSNERKNLRNWVDSQDKISQKIETAKDMAKKQNKDLTSNFYVFLYERYKLNIIKNSKNKSKSKSKSKSNFIMNLMKSKNDSKKDNDNLPYTDYDYCVPEYINSSAVVRLKKGSAHPTNLDYVNYIKHMLNDLKIRFPEFNREDVPDIELLADVQHKGAATCLVDFSRNFLTSLWFATQNLDDDIGYLFCYDINKALIEGQKLFILNKKDVSRNIENLLYETSKENYSYRYWLWRPSNLNSRIEMQDSVFIFGLEPFRIRDNDIIAIPIPPSWKKPIQYVLKMYFGMTAESIYCDIEGYADANSKTRPYKRTVVKYFNEKFGIQSVNDNNKDSSLNYLQCGMDCMFQGEYELAIKYFKVYEAKTEVNKLTYGGNNFFSNLKKRVLHIDEIYSKALCLKHIGDRWGAICDLAAAHKECDRLKDFISKKIDEIREYDVNGKDVALLKVYEDYLSNKQKKVFHDLVEMNFSVKQYNEVQDLLRPMVKSVNKCDANTDKKFNPQYLLYLLKIKEAQCCEEVLSFIDGKKMDSFSLDVDLTDLSNPAVEKEQPLLFVLNSYFDCIKGIIKKDNKKDNKKDSKDEFEGACKKCYNKTDKEYESPNLIARWDIKIIELLNQNKSNPDQLGIYKDLKLYTDQMLDFIVFVQSKIKLARS